MRLRCCKLLYVVAAMLLGAPDAAVAQSVVSASCPTVRSDFRTVAMQWLNRSGERRTTCFGLTVAPAESSESPSQRPLVVLVHGFNSEPQRNASLVAPAIAAGFRCATFRYPNDQPIADSAALLSQELRRLAEQQPGCKVAILTYSMGGLVARETIENPDLDPGNVVKLLMVAPPTQGTTCAYIGLSGDLLEHGFGDEGCGLLDRLYAALEDGAGEARYDLMPGSPFLKKLNARERNARVQYSMFLGTGGSLVRSQLDQADFALADLAESNWFVAMVQPMVHDMLSDLRDAAEPGDGVVSLARGKLDGVSDALLLGFDHWSVIDNPEAAPVVDLHREVLKRLESPPAADLASAK